MQKEHKMILFIGPSGCGKTTLSRIVRQQLSEVHFQEAVSSTSRLPRKGEREGIDYYFINPSDFQNPTKFLDKTHYAGNDYGLTYDEVNNKLQQGHTIAVVDINGLHQFEKFLGKQKVVSIFVYAPMNCLRKRMFKRGDSKEKVMQRLFNILQTHEYNNESQCDYIVFNDEDIQMAYHQVVDILKKEKIIW